MSLAEKPLGELWDGLSPGWRHSISLMILGALFTGLFFAFIGGPIARAAESDKRQDQAIDRNQKSIEKLSDAVIALQQTQAVQAQIIAEQQRRSERTETQLETIDSNIKTLLRRK